MHLAIHEELPLSRRYVYARIDHKELSRRLNAIGITARDLERASGADGRRVMRWLSGEEDIPPHVDLLTLLWLDIPACDEAILRWASSRCHDVRSKGLDDD